MILIPNLAETPFQRIEASVSVSLDQHSDEEGFAPSDCAQLAQIPGDRPIFVTLEMGQEIGETIDFTAWLTLSFDKPPSRPERARLAEDPSIQEQFPFSLDKWKQTDPESIWNEFSVFLDKTVGLRVDALFSIDRDTIPPESLVASMIGLRTKAGEEQLLLNGAQFSVRGFPDDTISWYMKLGSNNLTIAGNVIRNWLEEFNSESISDAVHVLEDRFHRVVRAQSTVKAHASS